MPAGSSVRPQKWNNVIDLYDDEKYSTIWGTYEEDSQRSLGVRWNGDNENHPFGYPNQGGNSLWYVEPAIFTLPILSTLLEKVGTSQLPRKPEYLHNILKALAEFTKQEHGYSANNGDDHDKK